MMFEKIYIIKGLRIEVWRNRRASKLHIYPDTQRNRDRVLNWYYKHCTRVRLFQDMTKVTRIEFDLH